MKLHGIVPALVTPLTEDERIDEAGLRRLVDFLLRGGVHGLFVNGSMGVFNLLKDEEQLRAIEIVVDQAAGRVPVMAGVSDTCTSRVIDKARQAARLGADFLSVLPPFYDTYTPKQVVRFYKSVAGAVDRPVLAYNNPFTMLTSMNVAIIAELAEIPNFAGIKDSCNNAVQYQEELRLLGGRPNFSILLGTTKLMTLGLFMGADGFIDGLHNIQPEWYVKLWDAGQAGDWAAAREWQLKVEALIAFASYEEWLGAFELLMREMGICERLVAQPLVPLTDAKSVDAVRALMRELGLGRISWR